MTSSKVAPRVILNVMYAVVIGFCCSDCHKQEINKAASATTNAQSLEPLLLLTTKTGNPRGDADTAEAFEKLMGYSLSSATALEVKQFKAAGWTPLKKNEAEWRKKTADQQALGYFKNGVYYVMYIRAYPNGKGVHVLHNLSHELLGRRSFFLPVSNAPKSGK